MGPAHKCGMTARNAPSELQLPAKGLRVPVINACNRIQVYQGRHPSVPVTERAVVWQCAWVDEEAGRRSTKGATYSFQGSSLCTPSKHHLQLVITKRARYRTKLSNSLTGQSHCLKK
eukprot:g56445.t1